MPSRILPFIVIAFMACKSSQQSTTILSPDEAIKIEFRLEAGTPIFTAWHHNQQVLMPSTLGLQRADTDFSTGMQWIEAPTQTVVKDRYNMQNAKKSTISYEANEQVVHLKNASGQLMDIIFRVSNDGLAFRYFFPGENAELQKITAEKTAFHFDTATWAWLQPMSGAKTGWEQTQSILRRALPEGCTGGYAFTYWGGLGVPGPV